MAGLIFALFLGGMVAPASAANYPCSGSKGDVSHCEGATFVCNDGSTSGSKKNCSAVHGKRASAASHAVPATIISECPCSGGQLCTGPRGGKYCITSGGSKSYK